ncbi:MAG: nucleotide exchange factor GrpE [Candidatus Omnitrophica bacterium]|nr:nucleotide exchange factor GrpE [Candidatus Omnitrophota bacterium]
MNKEVEHKKEEKKPKEKMVKITEVEYMSLLEKEKEVMDKMLLAQADIENTRKRMERDKMLFLRFSNEQIISELIPFVDDFKRAFAAADQTKEFEVLHKGVEMILKRLLDLLKNKGVTEIESQGKPFDPAFHEALMQVESDEHLENTVIEELEKGYFLNERVLRTAKVKVAKAKEELIKEEAVEVEQENNIEQDSETE